MGKDCRLCNNQKQIINSHIIPEFMYEPVYGEGKAIAVAGNFSTRDGAVSAKKFGVTSGFSEHLLCAECDNETIGKIEGAVRDSIHSIRNHNFLTGFDQISVDYKTFKLFQLSLIWRASISTNRMFSSVRLGEKNEEKIRKMILSENPGKHYEYGCRTFVTQHEHLRRSVVHAQADMYKGHHRFAIITPGIHFEYYISSHAVDIPFKNTFLQENNKLPIIKSSMERDADFIRLHEELVWFVEDNK